MIFLNLSGLLLAAAFIPIEGSEALHNPYKGWAIIDHATAQEIDAGKSAALSPDSPAFSWYENAAILSTWAQVEVRPNDYDWRYVERAAAYWAGLGKTLHFRFSTEDFGNIVGLPRWLEAMGVPLQKRGGQCFPDYHHPVYQDRLSRFLEAFAQQYFDDPRFETIDLRAYGNWGEWHSGYEYPNVADRVQALRSLIDLYRKANAGRHYLCLSASYEWESWYNSGKALLPYGTSIYDTPRPSYADFLYRSAFDYAMPFEDITLRRDGIGGAVVQDYDGRLLATFFQHYRKPIFGEFFGPRKAYCGPSPVGFSSTTTGDKHIGNAVDELLNHHPTYSSPLGWKGQDAAAFYTQDFAQVLKGHRWMGYRFVLVQAECPDTLRPGAAFELKHDWENRALGRCYKRYAFSVALFREGKLAWEGIDPNFDSRNFVSGAHYACRSGFQLPDHLAEGRYQLAVALVDDTGSPALRLAINDEIDEKRYRLGEVEISKAALKAPSSPAPALISRIVGGWKCGTALAGNRAYQVTFKYLISKNPRHDLNTESPGYFTCYAQNKAYRRVGESRCYDKAGQPWALKTLLIHTVEDGPYHLYWEAVGGGAMQIDEVYIEALPQERIRRVDIRSDQVALLPGAARWQQFWVSAQRDQSQVTLPDDWAPYLRSRPESLPLKPETTYRVYFDCAVRPQLWQGDYPYLCVKRTMDDDPEKSPAFFRWSQRHTAGYERHAYSFRTGPGVQHFLEWGLKNGGQCRIAHIVIEELGR